MAERPKTKAEKQAEAAVAARDKLSAEADQKRLEEEEARAKEEEARVATLTPPTPKGEDGEEEVPELTEQGQPVLTEEGTAKARPLSEAEVATQKALDERDALLAKQDKEREEQEKRKLE